MNNNYKRQLQEAYRQGYHQQLNEFGPAIRGVRKGVESLWNWIRTPGGRPNVKPKPLDPIPPSPQPKPPTEWHGDPDFHPETGIFPPHWEGLDPEVEIQKLEDTIAAIRKMVEDMEG